jgi:ABC-type branched-subunit amino acid transport system ATPase component
MGRESAGVVGRTRAIVASEDEITHAALKYLHFVGILEYAQYEAGSLAYGLQRRVEIARALACAPELLLLDEPAAGMNPQETSDLSELIERIRDAGVTVFLIEHDMSLVMRISEHITVLDHGEVIARGTPKEIQNNPSVIEAYLGSEAEL